MKKELVNIETWKRKTHYNFFKNFDEPFLGITANVDCRKTFEEAKDLKKSFFLTYLYKSLQVVNTIPAFALRIDKGKVYRYDRVDAAPTIGRRDHTFGYSFMKYYEDEEKFMRLAKKEVARVQATTTLEPATNNENVIHYTTVPWIHFTGLSHARVFGDSVPKIAFGKMVKVGNQLLMPVAVHAHHALVDGYDVGQFFELFQKLL